MMRAAPAVVLVRLLPVMIIAAAAIAYIYYVEGPDLYALRNALPVLAVVLLAGITVYRGGGRWTGAGWRWPLGTAGFAVPALGLSLYLHYGYSVDLDGIVSQSLYPAELFRYLPIYTAGAGGLGFAIGWIAGRHAG